MAENIARKGEFTGWHMLALMVAFFGVVIGVNVFMAASAIRTWTGLVVENSYVASQEFNSKLTISRDRTSAGWQGGLDYDGSQLLFSLTDVSATPIPLETVTIAISRPIGVAEDQTLILDRAPDGRYVTSITLAPGVWNAAIVAEVPNEAPYEHRARLVVE